ncbi:hypothetical protein CALCODRAFT_148254 [Calocera cornea HHB12733]|uniref:Uncharacterized protein n=1 Tax=Calocera cornea HHB12733 TaxID=1353952 RepID=A0A165CQ58_9BASI|nr:hypothetical protein CALCODRAFT_148254 [Calocera cornea HHB12733]
MAFQNNSANLGVVHAFYCPLPYPSAQLEFRDKMLEQLAHHSPRSTVRQHGRGLQRLAIAEETYAGVHEALGGLPFPEAHAVASRDTCEEGPDAVHPRGERPSAWPWRRKLLTGGSSRPRSCGIDTSHDESRPLDTTVLQELLGVAWRTYTAARGQGNHYITGFFQHGRHRSRLPFTRSDELYREAG